MLYYIVLYFGVLPHPVRVATGHWDYILDRGSP